jgi:histidinol phosphatase-like enzyme
MVTNQDGLGTASHPESIFSHTKFHYESFENEGVLWKNSI